RGAPGLPHADRRRRRRRGDDTGRSRHGGASGPPPAGLHPSLRRTVWVLHRRHDHGRRGVPRCRWRARPGGDPACARRPRLPLHRLREDRRRRRGGRDRRGVRPHGDRPEPRHDECGRCEVKAVGARLPRYDGVAHVTGRTVFVDDVRVPGTLYLKALRSPVHHADLIGLDTGPAERMKGVHAVVTHEDVPLNVYGHLSALGIPGDEPLLAETDVRYKGQPIAIVAAEDEETAQAAVEAIGLDLNEKPALFDVRKAFDADAPQIHHWGNWYPHFENEMDRRQIRKGDIEAAFDAADTIVQGVYRPAAIE